MYESPIQIIEHDIHMQMQMQMEDGILKAVKQVGIHVDKEELLRALEYDRKQYDRGFTDGKLALCARLLNRFKEIAYDEYYSSDEVIKLDDVIEILQEEGLN